MAEELMRENSLQFNSHKFNLFLFLIYPSFIQLLEYIVYVRMSVVNL